MSADALYYEAYGHYFGAELDVEKAKGILRQLLYQCPTAGLRTRAVGSILLARILSDYGSASDRKEADRWYDVGSVLLHSEGKTYVDAIRREDDERDAVAAAAAANATNAANPTTAASPNSNALAVALGKATAATVSAAAAATPTAGDTKSAPPAAATAAAGDVKVAAAVPIAAASASSDTRNPPRPVTPPLSATATSVVTRDRSGVIDIEMLCALSECYANGRASSIPKEPRMAARLCERACVLGAAATADARAAAVADSLLGVYYATGLSFGLSVKNAVKLWTAAIARWEGATGTTATAAADSKQSSASVAAVDVKSAPATAAGAAASSGRAVFYFPFTLQINKSNAALLGHPIVQRHFRSIRIADELELTVDPPTPAAPTASAAAALAAAAATTAALKADTDNTGVASASVTTAHQLAAFGRTLTYLDLGSRRGVTARTLATAFAGLSELRVLRMSDLSAKSLIDYSSFVALPKLQALIIPDNLALALQPALVAQLCAPPAPSDSTAADAASASSGPSASVLRAPLSTHLLTLDLSHCRTLTDSAFAPVATLPVLQYLDIRHCRLLTAASCRAIGSSASLPNTLRGLNMYDADGCLNDIALAQLSSCTRLEQLNLAGIPPIDDDGRPTMGAITDDGLTAALRMATKMTALDLSFTGVTGAGLRKIVSGMKQLRFIYLLGCQNLTDDALEAFAAARDTIEVVDLAACRKLTGNPVIAGAGQPAASAAAASTDSTSGTDASAAAAPATGVVVATPTVDASGAPIPAGAAGAGARAATIAAALALIGPVSLHGAKRLISLTVGSCPEWRSLGSGLTQCTELRYLAVGASLVGDMQLRFLPNSGSLTAVNLSCCNQLTNAGLTVVAERTGAALRYLDVSACHNIDDTGLSEFGANGQCSGLRRLNVQNVELSGECWIQLGAGCPDLEDVNWRGSAHDTGLALLTGALAQLPPAAAAKRSAPSGGGSSADNSFGADDADDDDSFDDAAPAPAPAPAPAAAATPSSGDSKSKTDRPTATTSSGGLSRSLRILDIGNSNDLTDAGVAHLPRLYRLQCLQLDECFGLTDGSIAPLCRLSPLRLEVLNLRGGLGLGAAGKVSLAAALPNCKSLFYPRNTAADVARHRADRLNQARKERAKKRNQKIVAQAAATVRAQALQELAMKTLAESDPAAVAQLNAQAAAGAGAGTATITSVSTPPPTTSPPPSGSTKPPGGGDGKSL